MIDGTLGTTNTLLAILAVIAVLEGIALIVATVVVVFVCRHIRDLLGDLREQIPRLADRVDALTVQVTDVLADAREVVADVRDVSSRAAAGAERMQTAVAGATDVASLAVYLVFGRKAALATGIVRGVGLAYRILTRGSAGSAPLRPVDGARPRAKRTIGPARATRRDPSVRHRQQGQKLDVQGR